MLILHENIIKKPQNAKAGWQTIVSALLMFAVKLEMETCFFYNMDNTTLLLFSLKMELCLARSARSFQLLLPL